MTLKDIQDNRQLEKVLIAAGLDRREGDRLVRARVIRKAVDKWSAHVGKVIAIQFSCDELQPDAPQLRFRGSYRVRDFIRRVNVATGTITEFVAKYKEVETRAKEVKAAVELRAYERASTDQASAAVAEICGVSPDQARRITIGREGHMITIAPVLTFAGIAELEKFQRLLETHLPTAWGRDLR